MNFIPNTELEQREMLKEIGVRSLEELLIDIPEELRKVRLNLEEGLSELELLKHLKRLSDKNGNLDDYISFLGAGAYDHFIPSLIKHLTSRGEFYTAYTPYQPEVSQGTLQAIYEYQTLICELTGMEVSNASMYDGASALAEAAFVAISQTRKNKIVISKAIHPEYRMVLKSYLRGMNTEIAEVEFNFGSANSTNSNSGQTDIEKLRAVVDEDTAGVLMQNPNFFGCIEPMETVSKLAHSKGALLVASVNPISLGILKPPGEYDADIAVGEGQALGNPISFGGPYLGFFATKQKFIHKLPGRLVGMSQDSQGRRGFVLTLQGREQHIRREKATSNICTNQALNALAACIYLCAIGKNGIKEVAELNLHKSHYAYQKIGSIDGFDSQFEAPFFNEFLIKSPINPDQLNKALLEKQIIGGVPLKRFYPNMPNIPNLKNCILFCVTEMRSKEEIDALVDALSDIVK